MFLEVRPAEDPVADMVAYEKKTNFKIIEKTGIEIKKI